MFVSAVILLVVIVATIVPAQRTTSNDDVPMSDRLVALEEEVAKLNRKVQDFQLADKLTGHWVEKSWIRSGERIDESETIIGGGGGGSGGPVEWRLATDVNSQRWVLAPEPVDRTFGKFSVDTSKSPAWIDFHVTKNEKHYVMRGIVICTYKQAQIAIPTTLFDGESFLDPPRPTSFESTKENGYSVYSLVRESFDRTGVF
jgi:hypothetical protein